MINKIGFQNYKGFKSGFIEVKPITILLGANSSGKSSIMQLFLLLTQTFNNIKDYKSALRLNGEILRLGEYENVLHNKKLANELGFAIDSNVFKIDFEKRRLFDQIDDIYFSLQKIYSLLNNEKIVFSRYNRGIRVNELMSIEQDGIEAFFKELSTLKRKINNQFKHIPPDETEKLILLYFRSIRFRKGKSKFYSKQLNKVIVDFSPYEAAVLFLKKIDKIEIPNITVGYNFIYSKGKIEINRISLFNGHTNIISYQFQKVVGGKRHVLDSDLMSSDILQKYSRKFGNSIQFDNLNIIYTEKYNQLGEDDIFIDTIVRVFRRAIDPIRDQFSTENINYVGPLRAYPRRYYFLDEEKSTNSLNTIDGTQLAEILKDKNEIRRKVNQWLLKFDFRVNTSFLKDIIHNISVNQSGLVLDITDVGFGISQVLPIMVQGFLSEPNSITLIEQPEIHLHPKMQSELADLFIDIIHNGNEGLVNKSLIIETHSEYLLKRLRRRMAEGKVKPSEVAIYLINPRSSEIKSATIKRLEIDGNGGFEWPKDFYDDEIKDTIEFLKRQK